MKLRLDTLLVERGLVTGRDRARGIIMAGQVYIDNQKADKPGTQVNSDANVEVRGNQLAYVSRGGLKLEKAIAEFAVALEGAVCADIGASTGGFTDCMLSNGAAKVYAIDVGYGQLAWKLRIDQRVVVLERTNIRYITQEQIAEPLDFCSIDVSFISLALVLPVAARLLKPKGEVVCLVKPQFEAGRDKVGKKGVVRDPQTHKDVLMKTLESARVSGFSAEAVDYSPIKGPEGNIEYLLHLILWDNPNKVDCHAIDEVVAKSHSSLQVSQ